MTPPRLECALDVRHPPGSSLERRWNTLRRVLVLVELFVMLPVVLAALPLLYLSDALRNATRRARESPPLRPS